MKDFFHGWRRKAGIVTLVLACVATLAWIKSLSVQDVIAVDVAGRTHFFVSHKSHVFWVTIAGSAVPPPILWTSGQPTQTPDGGYVLGETKVVIFARSGIKSAPYWPCVLPLTLTSACLLLWNPRKKPPQSRRIVPEPKSAEAG